MPAPIPVAAELVLKTKAPEVSWDEILTPARPFLEQVSRRLEAQVDGFEPEISGQARYALDNRGKQLRPAFVGLCAGSVGSIVEDHVTIAVLLEMIHLATLVHDDIMDGAVVRRGRPTVGARWGNHVAVLLGDCLFAHAMRVAAGLQKADISKSLAEASNAVCSGEILQTNRRRRWDLPRSEYLRMVEMKTAELFAVAAELGARHAGGTEAQVTALRDYARAAGTAYQIYDDCLDLYGSESLVGKSLGTDLATGKLTLPLIVLLERASPADASEILGWLDDWKPDYMVGLRALLDTHGALAECAAVIEGLLQKAGASLGVLPDTPQRDALRSFTRLISRQTLRLSR